MFPLQSEVLALPLISREKVAKTSHFGKFWSFPYLLRNAFCPLKGPKYFSGATNDWVVLQDCTKFTAACFHCSVANLKLEIPQILELWQNIINIFYTLVRMGIKAAKIPHFSTFKKCMATIKPCRDEI